jgi:hypothetical protein
MLPTDDTCSPSTALVDDGISVAYETERRVELHPAFQDRMIYLSVFRSPTPFSINYCDEEMKSFTIDRYRTGITWAMSEMALYSL